MEDSGFERGGFPANLVYGSPATMCRRGKQFPDFFSTQAMEVGAHSHTNHQILGYRACYRRRELSCAHVLCE